MQVGSDTPVHRFEITSPVGTSIFQADSEEDLLAWCSTIYNALSVANGGGFLLQMERQNEGVTTVA